MTDAPNTDVDSTDANPEDAVDRQLFLLLDELTGPDASLSETVENEVVSMLEALSESLTQDDMSEVTEDVGPVSDEAFELVEKNVFRLMNETHDAANESDDVQADSFDERAALFDELLAVMTNFREDDSQVALA